MSSLSDQFRRLFSGTLGLLPIVFPNRDQGGTLVHFWRDCPHSEVGACQLLPAARTHNLLDKLEWALAVPGVVLSCKPRLKLEFVITRHCPAAVSGYNECRRSTGRPTLCSSSSACGDTFN